MLCPQDKRFKDFVTTLRMRDSKLWLDSRLMPQATESPLYTKLHGPATNMNKASPILSLPHGSTSVSNQDVYILPHGSNTVFEFLHSPRIIPSYPMVPTPSSSSYTHHGSFRHTPRFQHHLRVPTLTTDHSIINHGSNTVFEFLHSPWIIPS